VRVIGAIASEYKSLQAVELPLEGLTVLFGPNGSGKTNLIEALGVHDPMACRTLGRTEAHERAGRARIALVAQFDVTSAGAGLDADVFYEMLVAPWVADMDMDEVAEYLGAYCGSNWWMYGGRLHASDSKTLSSVLAVVREAILSGVSEDARSRGAELLHLLFDEPVLLVQEDFAVELSCDRETAKGRRIRQLVEHLEDGDSSVLGHMLGVLRSWTGRWPPLTVLTCGPGAEPRETSEPLVPAGFRWLVDRLGGIRVVSGDVTSLEEHLDEALERAHDRLLHRPESLDLEDEGVPSIDEFCSYCLHPDHGGAVNPAIYGGAPMGPYEGRATWLEEEGDGWIRVRPSLIDVLELIENEANRRLLPFVAREGKVRLEVRPVTEWEASSSKCRVMFDVDPGEVEVEPASWGGAVGVAGHARQVSADARSVPLADLGAGLRRWVATAVRLAADACTSGEITVTLAGEFVPADEAQGRGIESVHRTDHVQPRIVLVDEPEQHLHPLAQRQIAQWLVERARENHAVVVATHSAAFFSLPPHQARICEVRRVGHSTKVRPLRQVHGPEAVQRSRELGFELGLGSDALAQLTRAVVVVEGDWDSRLLQYYFGHELAEQRILVVPLQGAYDFGSLADAAVIPSLGVPVAALLDEVRASSPEDLANLQDPLTKAERALRSLAGAIGSDLKVIRYPDPDVICALSEEAVRAAYPGLDFPGWPDLLKRWEESGRPKSFKSWALAEIRVPGNDRKPPSRFFRNVLEHAAGTKAEPTFRAAVKQLLAELS
jgi:predicted ATPase